MTQGEIEKLTVKVSNIFSELEVRIMTDIVRRIKENGFASASVDWQISRLQQLGMAEEDIRGLCEEAVTYGFHSVCVNSSCVALCASLLKNTGIKVCTVIGFPLGAMSTTAKIAEATAAVKDGAKELDMVIHIGALKSGNWDYVRRDIGAVVAAAGDDVIVKVILETCLLTDEEIQEACLVSRDAGADYVKTSTGFSTGGATVEAVSLMKRTVGSDMKVKASGGIHTLEDARKMFYAGADRIGSSSGVAIAEAEMSEIHTI